MTSPGHPGPMVTGVTELLLPDPRPIAVARADRAAGATLTVDLAAVAANTRFFATRTRAEVMAVVKADGFGHGGAETARTALENGATWLGVTSITEGLALREAGLAAPML